MTWEDPQVHGKTSLKSSRHLIWKQNQSGTDKNTSGSPTVRKVKEFVGTYIQLLLELSGQQLKKMAIMFHIK